MPPPRVFRLAPALGLALVPSLARAATGHFDVRAECADKIDTPAEGLRVSVDGVVTPAVIVNEGYASYETTSPHGHPTFHAVFEIDSVGFEAPSGPHNVRVESSECGAMEGDLTLDESRLTYVETSLPIHDTWLRGPVGAPDGFFLGLSALVTQLPKTMASNAKADGVGTFDLDDHTLYGGIFTAGWAHRFFTVMGDFDLAFGGPSGLATGVETKPVPLTHAAAARADVTGRIGLRLPLRYAAFAGGTGLGFAWMTMSSSELKASRLAWSLPLWATATIKPTCDFGVQLGATYHFDPTSARSNAALFTAGLVWESNEACARRPSFIVRPE